MTHIADMKVTLHDGVKMPVLGLGAYQIEGDVTEAVLTAIRLGYRLIDTAAMYANEAEVGAAVRTAVEQGIASREELFVTTKVWKTELGYERTLAAFERSYQALGLETVDLYLIHWPGSDADNLGSWRALIELQKQGKVRSIGVSNFEPEQLAYIIEQTGHKPVVDQVEFNPSRTRMALHQYCRENGIQLEAWGPLGKGRLLSEPIFTELGRKYGKTPAQIILRWHLQHGVVAIPKSSREARMRENADIFDFQLTDEEMARISALDRS
jgi:diketogulonate reductase-like aldo/keto reductase